MQRPIKTLIDRGATLLQENLDATKKELANHAAKTAAELHATTARLNAVERELKAVREDAAKANERLKSLELELRATREAADDAWQSSRVRADHTEHDLQTTQSQLSTVVADVSTLVTTLVKNVQARDSGDDEREPTKRIEVLASSTEDTV